MIHQEKKTETKPVTSVVREWTTCDMCGYTIKKEPYYVEDGSVSLTTGTSYPEGSDTTEIRADLCKQCFTGVLVPFLESRGVRLQIIERG